MTSRVPDVTTHQGHEQHDEVRAPRIDPYHPPPLVEPFVMQYPFLLLLSIFNRWEHGHIDSRQCFVTAFQRTFVAAPRRLASGSRARQAIPPHPILVPRPRAALVMARMDDRRDDNDADAVPDGAMAEAFRQLDSLDASALMGDEATRSGTGTPTRTNLKMGEEQLSAVDPPSIETEARVYQDYLQEVEGKSEDDLYDDMLSDMGGSSMSSSSSSSSVPRSTTSTPSPSSSYGGSLRGDSNEELWNKALEEAMGEVKLNNPSISDSILDDAAFRKEIEAIFDRGNDKLLESLEEIRKEQQEWAKASADQSAQEAVDQLNADAIRLENAEANMRTMLDRVNKETSEVARAVQDLKTVQSQLDNDFLFKLKTGGIAKQLSFVGFVLFSLRSIADTVATLNSPGADLTVALIQGGIALACAVIFFLV